MLSRTEGYYAAKARTQLGYQQRVGLKDSMRHTEEWAQQTGVGAQHCSCIDNYQVALGGAKK